MSIVFKLGGIFLVFVGAANLIRSFLSTIPKKTKEELSRISSAQAKLLGINLFELDLPEFSAEDFSVDQSRNSANECSGTKRKESRWESMSKSELLAVGFGPNESRNLRNRWQFRNQKDRRQKDLDASFPAKSFMENEPFMEGLKVSNFEPSQARNQPSIYTSNVTAESSAADQNFGTQRSNSYAPISSPFRFQPSSSKLPAKGIYSQTQVAQNDITDQMRLFNAFLKNQGLEMYFASITENTRRYMANLLRENYAKPLSWVVKELNRRGVEMDVAKQIEARQRYYEFPKKSGVLHNTTLKDIIYKGLERKKELFDAVYPEEGCAVNTLSFYADLERALLVGKHTGYVFERVQQLAEDNKLGGMRWEGGGPFREKPWNENFPTDAEIVMHIFCCRMDEILARTSHERLDGQPFTSRYYLEGQNSKQDLTKYRSRVAILRTDRKVDNGKVFQSKSGPHYHVMVGDEIWVIPKNRLNVFQSIALFLWAVRKHKSGYLGDVNLRGRVLDEIFGDSVN
eukprot:CAMPEP_0171454374 /NCGR_PEP_ID=MMETSP0945-20130129/1683_1 /TAXON_ID=109269 /ORGANISM="Vaucheria litorea, Strain CCMP2940" /LENGTH=513 /DNA_ID=CAMNT_0011979379 /DNA_START=237 /DNA_END=1778 /DNA_ORIENTATION=-